MSRADAELRPGEDVGPLNVLATDSGCYSACVTSAGTLATGHSDGTVRIWDLRTESNGTILKRGLSASWALCMVADNVLASGHQDGRVRLWDLCTGDLSHTLSGHCGPTCAICMVSSDVLASASADKTARLWDVRTGAATHILTGHSSGLLSVCAASATIMATGATDHTVRLWNVRTGKSMCTLEKHTGNVWALCMVSVDILASGSSDSTVRLWNVRTGANTRTLEGHTSAVASLCVLSPGLLVSASHDNSVRLWDLRGGTAPTARVLAEHSSSGAAVCTVATGALAFAAKDRTVKLWNTHTGPHGAWVDPFIPGNAPRPFPLPAGSSADVASELETHLDDDDDDPYQTIKLVVLSADPIRYISVAWAGVSKLLQYNDILVQANEHESRTASVFADCLDRYTRCMEHERMLNHGIPAFTAVYARARTAEEKARAAAEAADGEWQSVCQELQQVIARREGDPGGSKLPSMLAAQLSSAGAAKCDALLVHADALRRLTKLYMFLRACLRVHSRELGSHVGDTLLDPATSRDTVLQCVDQLGSHSEAALTCVGEEVLDLAAATEDGMRRVGHCVKLVRELHTHLPAVEAFVQQSAVHAAQRWTALEEHACTTSRSETLLRHMAADLRVRIDAASTTRQAIGSVADLLEQLHDARANVARVRELLGHGTDGTSKQDELHADLRTWQAHESRARDGLQQHADALLSEDALARASGSALASSEGGVSGV